MILKMMKFTNPHLLELSEKGDSLHHFNITNKDKNFSEFSDVKFVCMGGKPSRMLLCAVTFHRAYYGTEALPNVEPENLTGSMDRYVLYKVGPVLFVSHGVGISSVGIVLHEMIKLVQYAGCSDVAFIRVGTSGGIGVDPGTVVVTDRAVNTKGDESHIFHGMGAPSISIMLNETIKLLYHAGCSGVTLLRLGTSGGIGLEAGSVVVSSEVVNGELEPWYELSILGEKKRYLAALDKGLSEEISLLGRPDDKFKVVQGKTMSSTDFYEGQSRLDGAFCDYTMEDKMKFLTKLSDSGVTNIEMEALCFATLTHRANISGAVVCVTLLNRLDGDQINRTAEELLDFERRPMEVVCRLIEKRLHLQDH